MRRRLLALEESVQELCEAGVPVVLAEPDSPAARALIGLATQFQDQASSLSVRLPIVGS